MAVDGPRHHRRRFGLRAVFLFFSFLRCSRIVSVVSAANSFSLYLMPPDIICCAGGRLATYTTQRMCWKLTPHTLAPSRVGPSDQGWILYILWEVLADFADSFSVSLLGFSFLWSRHQASTYTVLIPRCTGPDSLSLPLVFCGPRATERFIFFLASRGSLDVGISLQSALRARLAFVTSRCHLLVLVIAMRCDRSCGLLAISFSPVTHQLECLLHTRRCVWRGRWFLGSPLSFLIVRDGCSLFHVGEECTDAFGHRALLPFQTPFGVTSPCFEPCFMMHSELFFSHYPFLQSRVGQQRARVFTILPHICSQRCSAQSKRRASVSHGGHHL